eukprot:TRINITY_DN8490_c0_g1_i1.p1 TRINITY_DN8490_c0_g1~~TRINITY_DN8490_c0_g1_i1.p1  ORF type:complete len:364 (+),score=106.23 TRINITY_DN8490_c0_g1_i1:354-1445(+)
MNDGGIYISAHYFANDMNDNNRDPYCGDDDDGDDALTASPNVFAQFLDRLAADPLSFTTTYLPDGVCCGPDSMIPLTRTYETNDWCSIRDATMVLGILACIAALVATVAVLGALCFVNLHLYTMIIGNVLAGLLGMAATIVFSVWLAKEDNDIDNREFQDDIDGSVSYALFIIGWVFAFIAALVAFMAFFVDKHYDHKETNPQAYPYVTRRHSHDGDRAQQLEAVEVPPLDTAAAAAAARKVDHPGRNDPHDAGVARVNPDNLPDNPGRNHPDAMGTPGTHLAQHPGRYHPDQAAIGTDRAAPQASGADTLGNPTSKDAPIELHPGRYAPDAGADRPIGGGVVVDADEHERRTDLAVANSARV